MIGLKKVDDTWIVCKFVKGHNHKLLTPKSTSLLRGHRVITSAQKNLIDTLNELGIALSKIMSVLSKESNADYNVGCVLANIQNYLGSKRRKLLQDGDAQGMYKYFIESQCKNPGFVYAIKVDEYGCMGNAFRQMLGQECHTNILEMSLPLTLHTKQIVIRCLLFLS